jgi:hypothetical protein
MRHSFQEAGKMYDTNSLITVLTGPEQRRRLAVCEQNREDAAAPNTFRWPNTLSTWLHFRN